MSEESFYKTREEAIERDEYECQFCGVSNEEYNANGDRSLDVHHIVPRMANGSNHTENLITVCRSCHKKLESIQGDAIKRLKEQEAGVEQAEYDSVCEERDRLQERVERLEEVLEEGVEYDYSKVAAWLEKEYLRIDVVTFGNLDPDVEVYQDRKKAAEQYAEYDGFVTVETHKLSVKDFLRGNMKYEDFGNAELHLGKSVEMDTEDSEEIIDGFSIVDKEKIEEKIDNRTAIIQEELEQR
jgi:hypothetical protein